MHATWCVVLNALGCIKSIVTTRSAGGCCYVSYRALLVCTVILWGKNSVGYVFL